MKKSFKCTVAPLYPRFQRGLSLIELMVAMVIGLVVSLAIFSVMSVSEARKRNTTGANDMNQNGAFALYQLDQAIRSAGTGFSQRYALTFGCAINANNSGKAVIPPASLPSPFSSLTANIGGAFRMAPVIISQDPNGKLSDTLIVMAGSAGYGEMPIESTSVPTASPSALHLLNTLSFSAGQQLLVAERPGDSSGSLSACLLESVDNTYSGSASSGVLPLGGKFYTAGTDKALASYSSSSVALNLGFNPSFQLYGVGSNNALVAFDLLNGTAAGADLIADGVVEMHAIYGVDNANNGTIAWTAPTGTYAASALLDGSVDAGKRIAAIKAIRIGLITRSAVEDKNVVLSTATLPAMFDGTAFSYAKTLSEGEQKFRYRVLDATIPLRNALVVSD
ncbi:type IV pilus assembly protein PilW [Collimonas sp. OK242]|jgi:type IV pilus assembly protein PilW|uniref:PilW family protein n=1 Tax=Collimonas sp. OK242 TaxID=1798195 RepID=UPI000898EF6F|nr:PilW family protein [Collimonas sp. OK242]SDX07099.1 type IV pilus assembly protein PilW [Collimonas sp. OK242]